jgi:hypothetical protein
MTKTPMLTGSWLFSCLYPSCAALKYAGPYHAFIRYSRTPLIQERTSIVAAKIARKLDLRMLSVPVEVLDGDGIRQLEQSFGLLQRKP